MKNALSLSVLALFLIMAGAQSGWADAVVTFQATLFDGNPYIDIVYNDPDTDNVYVKTCQGTANNSLSCSIWVNGYDFNTDVSGYTTYEHFQWYTGQPTQYGPDVVGGMLDIGQTGQGNMGSGSPLVVTYTWYPDPVPGTPCSSVGDPWGNTGCTVIETGAIQPIASIMICCNYMVNFQFSAPPPVFPDVETPPSPPSSVPEPASIVLMSAGMLVLAGRQRWQSAMKSRRFSRYRD